MNNKPTTRLAAGFVLMLLAFMPTTNVAAEPSAVLYVPAGTTMTVDNAVNAPSILIEGTLLSTDPAGLVLVADEIRVAAGGQLIALDGTMANSNGGSIHLSAQAIVIEGAILAGRGYDAADSDALIGEDGGDGGSILLQAPAIQVHEGARLAPGAGGKGAAIHPSGRTAPLASGGDGGDAGIVLLDGSPSLPKGGGVFAPANGGLGGAVTVTDGNVELAQGGSGGDGAFFGTTDKSFVAPDGYLLFPAQASKEMPDTDELFESAIDVPGINFRGIKIDDDLASHYVDALLPCKDGFACLNVCDDGDLSCILGEQCDAGSLIECLLGYNQCLEDAADCGTSILDSDCKATDSTCVLALLGLEESGDGCGNGADGADVINSAGPGGHGGPGGAGSPGSYKGGEGAPGGDGEDGGAGNAKGGDGGNGRCIFAKGGDGGDGTGNGGTGGNGGEGGIGGKGDIFGGVGGTGGGCGAGGSGTGEGGMGGKGGPFGSPGKPGKGITNPGAPGVAGKGGMGGPGLVPGPSGAGGSCPKPIIPTR